VPTEFHAETFAAAGVSKTKLFVLGEPVDSRHFDPETHTRMDLPLLKEKTDKGACIYIYIYIYIYVYKFTYMYICINIYITINE